MVAKTFFGFEELLEKELIQLGAQNIQKVPVWLVFMVIKDLCIRPI